jgi:hypothetical protein
VNATLASRVSKQDPVAIRKSNCATLAGTKITLQNKQGFPLFFYAAKFFPTEAASLFTAFMQNSLCVLYPSVCFPHLTLISSPFACYISENFNRSKNF